MGPRGFGGPPPSEFNERLKEPLPKHIKEIPNYLKRVIGSFSKRLFYIIRLVFEAKKSLLILMVIMAGLIGVVIAGTLLPIYSLVSNVGG